MKSVRNYRNAATMAKPKSGTANNLHRQIIKLGKLNISYLTGGQGDPLIVIHGGGDSGRAWLQNAMELSKHYSIYVPDLPGFGHSQSISDNFNVSEYVTFVEDFSQSLGLKHFHLVGHSLGGGIGGQVMIGEAHLREILGLQYLSPLGDLS